MSEPKYRNVKWKSGEIAGIVDCPLQKNIMEHIGCPFFGGMRDKDKREQAVPQQYLGQGNVKRVTNVGCLYVKSVKVSKSTPKGESAAPPKVKTDDFGKTVAIDGIPVVEKVAEEGPQPGDGKSESVTGQRGPMKTDDVGNPIKVVDPVVVQEALTCDCGPDTWCNVCKNKMGKPDGAGHVKPQPDPLPQSPSIEVDVDKTSEAEDTRRAARDNGVAGKTDEELSETVDGAETAPQTTKEKDLASQLASAKKKPGGKTRKPNRKQSGKQA